MTPPLFLVAAEALDDDHVVLDGAEGRHASDVRRIRVGEAVDVGDGAGRIGHGVVSEVSRGRVVVEIASIDVVAMSQPRFVVAQALAKGGRDEDAVEAMTEIGVDEIVGWQAARSVARWSERAEQRWAATARSASKQAHRAWLPRVCGPASTHDIAERLSTAALAIVLHEESTRPLVDVVVPQHGDVVVVVGPEGGIAPEELAAFVAAGATPVRLGATVLRTSTAGVAALSVLSAQQRWR